MELGLATPCALWMCACLGSTSPGVTQSVIRPEVRLVGFGLLGLSLGLLGTLSKAFVPIFATALVSQNSRATPVFAHPNTENFFCLAMR